MNLPVIFAIAGCAALLVGLFGGGVKAKEIVVPKLATTSRIFSSLTGLILIGISIWVSQIPLAGALPTQIPPTQIPLTAILSTQIPPTEVPQPTATFTEQPHTPSPMITSIPASADLNSQAVFVHFVLSKNMRRSASAIEHPLSLDSKTLLFITSNYNPPNPPPNSGMLYNQALAAVWYTKLPERETQWTIINQSSTQPLNQGAAFNVQILSKGENAFLHLATSANSTDSWTAIDPIAHPLAADPKALVFAMPAWGPPGGGSANDPNHPVGVSYIGKQWVIFNMDGAPMSEGAGFNVEILSPDDKAFIHTATISNSGENLTEIDNHPLVADDENKLVFVMPRGSPDGSEVNNSQPIGVWWTGKHWVIFNQNYQIPMPVGTAFNVLILDAK